MFRQKQPKSSWGDEDLTWHAATIVLSTIRVARSDSKRNQIGVDIKIDNRLLFFFSSRQKNSSCLKTSEWRMSFDVKVDEIGVMFFTVAHDQGPFDWSQVPMGKALSEATQRRYDLPPLVTKRIKSHVFFREGCCGKCLYCCVGMLLCFLPYMCWDQRMWDNDRDPTLVGKEVTKLFNSLGISPGQYRLLEHVDSSDVFDGGRTVLKVHFNREGVVEL
ncbi:hypothetical protein BSKO_09527 [Bryopsis sp. KO-2023]|nr:hypothetical protein BSKO_09527 [Bryopsis sp. KO-2023]